MLGFEGAGKSTLAYSLSKHLQKKGIEAEAANFDAGCRHIKYDAAFDVRNRYSLSEVMRKYGLTQNAALKRIYSSLAKDATVKKALEALDCDATLLDVEAPVEVFLSNPSFVREYADAALFVCDAGEFGELEARALSRLLGYSAGVPVHAVLNKCDKEERGESAQKGLEGFSADAELKRGLEAVAEKAKCFRVSAMDRRGFDALYKELD